MKLRYILALICLAVLLAGCDAFSQRSSQPLPTVVLDAPGGPGAPGVTATAGAPRPVPLPAGGVVVTASGNIAPYQQAQLAFALGGSLMELSVKEGDSVRGGQTLARLGGGEKLAAALAAANLELLSAQQALKALQDNLDKQRSTAQVRLANAQKNLDEAQKRREWRQYRNGSQSQIDAAQADLILATEALRNAEQAYSAFASRAEDDLNRAAALSALSAARRARDKALATLNYLLAMPNKIELDQAEAELKAAQFEMESAQKDYERLLKGPDPDALALVEERIKNAKAQQAASQAALAELELKAPFGGTVARLRARKGEVLLPNQAVLVLADLSRLVVETSDLSERDVPKVAVGQPCSVLVKAINQTIGGKVSAIAPLADTLGGDVVYKTTVELDTIPPGLRPGMSAEVQFLSK